jgi:hypothetical protein
MKTITRLLASLSLVLLFACGGDDDGSDNPGTDDAGVGDDGGGGGEGDASCYSNPTTHNQIINACTEAESPPDKDPDLPLLNDDGTVPDPLVCE